MSKSRSSTHTGRASPQRHLADLLAVPRNLRQPLLDRGQQGLVAQPARGLRRIDSEPTYIGVEVFSS